MSTTKKEPLKQVEEPTAPLTLIERMQCVSTDVMTIEKDLTVGNAGYGYKAVSDLAVTLAIKKSEKAHGVMSIPIKQELVKSEILTSPPTDKGKATVTYVDIIKMTVRFFNVENVADTLDVEAYGRGLDFGDKGFGKASTYARKYALMNAYKIATGVDPDAVPSKATEIQIPTDYEELKVKNYLHNDDKYREQVLSHYGYGSTDELLADDIKKIAVNLRKKQLI